MEPPSRRPRVTLLRPVLAVLLVAAAATAAWHALRAKSAAAMPVVTAIRSIRADVPSCAATLRNEGRKRVGIQAGHYQIDQLPDEQQALQADYGASAGGVNEVDINLDVAQKAVAILQADGVQADLLPATVPAAYCADAFLAIHADGNDDPTVYGYKVAPSSWDADGRAQALSDDVSAAYEAATGMYENPAVSDNMTQYYAFNFQRFTHALDPATPGALLELGFVTNSTDRAVMTQEDQELAQAVATGVLSYLGGAAALAQPSSSLP